MTTWPCFLSEQSCFYSQSIPNDRWKLNISLLVPLNCLLALKQYIYFMLIWSKLTFSQQMLIVRQQLHPVRQNSFIYCTDYTCELPVCSSDVTDVSNTIMHHWLWSKNIITLLSVESTVWRPQFNTAAASKSHQNQLVKHNIYCACSANELHTERS